MRFGACIYIFALQISPLMQNQMEKKGNFDYTVAWGPELLGFRV